MVVLLGDHRAACLRHGSGHRRIVERLDSGHVEHLGAYALGLEDFSRAERLPYEVPAGEGAEETVVVDDVDDKSGSRKTSTRHLPSQTATTTPSNMEEETMDGGTGGAEPAEGIGSASMMVEDTLEDDEGSHPFYFEMFPFVIEK